MKHKLHTTITVMLFTAFAFSQAPQGMNYQAAVRDSQGNLVTNHAVGFKFNIRQGSGSGTIVYSETQTPNTDQFGGIALVIGQGTVVSGTFSAINWASGTYFNEVLLDVTGGINYVSMGASQLMSVPYALYAKSAGCNSPNGFAIKFNGTFISDSSLNFAYLDAQRYATRNNYWFTLLRGNNSNLYSNNFGPHGFVTDTINNTPIYETGQPGNMQRVLLRSIDNVYYVPLNATTTSVTPSSLFYYDPSQNRYMNAVQTGLTINNAYQLVPNNPSVTGFNLTFPVNVTIERQ